MVASVGPYALSMTRPVPVLSVAQRSTSSGGQASPATTSDAASNPCGDNIIAADGVWVSIVTPSATSSSCSSSGARAAVSDTTTRRPPCSRAPKISHTETSKARECHWLQTRAAGNWSSSRPSRPTTLRCVMATPLGTPVVPEV
ncbi:Uncharacterised protein [Mycobacteroides abscessus subsp. abscessus]|nr:Uncharacterised protein [Mycobacteroides abscessus subsp. abscessus]